MNPIIYVQKEVYADENGKILGEHPDNNVIGSQEVVVYKLTEYNASGWASGTNALLVDRYQQTAQGDFPIDIDIKQTVNKTDDDEFWEQLTEHYDCKGFAPDGYLTDDTTEDYKNTAQKRTAPANGTAILYDSIEDVTRKITAIDAIKTLLDNAPKDRGFKEEVRMIHAFTQDILDGKFDSAEDTSGESL